MGFGGCRGIWHELDWGLGLSARGVVEVGEVVRDDGEGSLGSGSVAGGRVVSGGRHFGTSRSLKEGGLRFSSRKNQRKYDGTYENRGVQS